MTPGSPIGYLIYLAQPHVERRRKRILDNKSRRRRAIKGARAGTVRADGGQEPKPDHPWRMRGLFREPQT